MGGIDLKWFVVVSVLVSVILLELYEALKRRLSVVKQDLISLYFSIINSYLTYLIALFLLGILVSYIFYKAYRKMQKIKERNRKIEEERRYVGEFLEADLRGFDYEGLKSKLNELVEKDFLVKHPELNSKIEEAENILVELKHKEELENLSFKKSLIEEEIKELEKKKEELERSEKQKRYVLIGELDLDENKVFDKSELSDEKIKILLEEGYKQVNEYCVAKKEIITVLIRPTLNHSVAHTFLVWSVRKLLEEYEAVERIIEHETRDADLTFRVGKKTYAIEIETGTLLGKKKQLKGKMKLLNEKYKKRWMIVVSKRDLVNKYKEFGVCTQRKWVCEKLEKMIGI